MTQMMQFNVPLRVGIINAADKPLRDSQRDTAKTFLNDHDQLISIEHQDLSHVEDLDVLIVADPCGPTPLARLIAQRGLPTLALTQHRGFHPYHAAFHRDIEKYGGILLPSEFPETIESSIAAVRCRRAITTMKLVVADGKANALATERIHQFAKNCHKQLGVEVVVRATEGLYQQADACEEQAVTEQLQHWHEHLFEEPLEMDESHMRQVVRLYLAQCAMLEEEQAVGFTVHDIRDFLQAKPSRVMPNVAYGALVCDGYLAVEEADIEVLATELLLCGALGEYPTMSNLYYSFRDQFDALDTFADYTSDMELLDCRQCFEDNHLTAAHFSTSGILPPNMMIEDRYRVRETLPAWPGQSMISSTPRMGPVAVARFGLEATSIHCVQGEITKLGLGDQYGWYRGRWFIQLPDTSRFAQQMLHQHYAIGPTPRAIASKIRSNTE